jgi:hypothetical protein
MGFRELVWRCDVCGKTVSRLLGWAAAVEIGGTETQIRPIVRGFCVAHREAVPESYRRDLERMGTVVWWADDIVELRPRDVDDFLLEADRALGTFRMPGAPPVDPSSTDCPQCGASVEWGTGPHVEDAAMRRGALAWVCTECGAAGLARLR